MMSPLTPHFAEELWQILGYKNLVTEENWPEYNRKLFEENTINLIIQVNGKKKLVINIRKGLNESETKELVLNNDKVKDALTKNTIKKLIVVPDRVVNLVI